MGIEEIFGGIPGGGMFGLITNVIWIFLGLGILAFCGFVVYYFKYKKKNWNLDVEIKIPRSDGRLITAEHGKGNYDDVKGACFIKRKGKKPVPMKAFDPKKFIQGERILTVVQLSPGMYIPVLPDSFLKVKDDKTGEVAFISDLQADYNESKSWKNAFERDAKQAYSITNLLREYAPYIGVGIIIFMNFAGFTILYSKVT